MSDFRGCFRPAQQRFPCGLPLAFFDHGVQIFPQRFGVFAALNAENTLHNDLLVSALLVISDGKFLCYGTEKQIRDQYAVEGGDQGH